MLLTLSTAARADEPPPVAAAMAAGVATALVPLAIGTTIVTVGESDRTRNFGLLLAMNGLAAAPIVAHLAVGERGRALLFGALPTASLVAMVVMLEVRPQVIEDLGFPAVRVPFATILIASLLSSAGGLVDAFLAGERWRRVHVVPTVAPGALGLAIGGAL